MGNRLPAFSDKHKICIICEGNEEYAYLERLNLLNVWNAQYEISLNNAGVSVRKYSPRNGARKPFLGLFYIAPKVPNP
jgi:hypothetical protein